MKDKFKEAIINLAIYRNQFDSITKEIAVQLGSCLNGFNDDFNIFNFVHKEPHLIEGFIEIKKAKYNESPAIEDFIYDCQYCQDAYKLIIERKSIKAKLGHAKRQITRLGNIEIKARD